MDNPQYGEIRNDIVELLQASRAASARHVNVLMTATYWEIGRRIVEFEQEGHERAEYGEAVINALFCLRRHLRANSNNRAHTPGCRMVQESVG
jgi:hypothetical protein